MTQVAAPDAAALEPRLERIPLTKLHDHPANPRKHFAPEAMAELTQSVASKGVLVPLSVRKNASGYEILGGARRFRAAQAAGLKDVPALVRDVDDATALELVVLDNLQRSDLHPLEEAAGLHHLSRQPGYDIAKVAARVGRSVKYVYDRLKLLSLTKDAQKLFLDGRFAAGHAILLARLAPADQARALHVDEEDSFSSRHGGMWQEERTLFDPTADDDRESADIKAVSVRELEAWIADNVRFDPERDADPMLFPETAAKLEAAPDDRKVVPITFHYRVPDAARSKDRTYGEKAWKRADGKSDSKTCEYARMAFVAAGAHRGEAFEVCVANDRCKVHWASEMRERAKLAAARSKNSSGSGSAKKANTWQEDQAAREEQEKKRDAERARWKKAWPQIQSAIAEKLAAAPLTLDGPVAKAILKGLSRYGRPAKAGTPGKGPDGLLRHLAAIAISTQLQLSSWQIDSETKEVCGWFGIDAKAIVDAAAPVQPSAQPAAKKARKKK